MEIQINENDSCFYKTSAGNFYIASIFKSQIGNGWYADCYDGSGLNDFFSGYPFKTKQEALKHVDETMKGIFKRILDEP